MVRLESQYIISYWFLIVINDLAWSVYEIHPCVTSVNTNVKSLKQYFMRIEIKVQGLFEILWRDLRE